MLHQHRRTPVSIEVWRPKAGIDALPGDLAAALELYKVGHDVNNGGAIVSCNMKFAVSEHTDPFRLPPSTNGGTERPVQKSPSIY